MKTIGCLCGYPDWPGQCPGPYICPVHGEDLSAKPERDPDEERERRRDREMGRD